MGVLVGILVGSDVSVFIGVLVSVLVGETDAIGEDSSVSIYGVRVGKGWAGLGCTGPRPQAKIIASITKVGKRIFVFMIISITI